MGLIGSHAYSVTGVGKVSYVIINHHNNCDWNELIFIYYYL